MTPSLWISFSDHFPAGSRDWTHLRAFPATPAAFQGGLYATLGVPPGLILQPPLYMCLTSLWALTWGRERNRGNSEVTRYFLLKGFNHIYRVSGNVTGVRTLSDDFPPSWPCASGFRYTRSTAISLMSPSHLSSPSENAGLWPLLSP